MSYSTAETTADTVPLVDLKSQYQSIRDEVDEALREVLDQQLFIKGPVVSAFESELASYLKGGTVLGVGSGTAALHVALMALDIGEGDEVLTPSFSFVAAAEAVALVGAKPVFVDIDPATYNLDVRDVVAKITPRSKVILPVHLFGQPADMDAISSIAKTHGLWIVEDCAQSIGATYRGQSTGLIGHLACTSFFPSKNLAAFGDGGAVYSRDDRLIEQCRLIANHGAKRKYHNETVGLNSRLDALQAAVLRVKLRHLDEFTEKRRAAARRYDELLADLAPTLTTPRRAEDRTHVFHQYTVRLKGHGPELRDKLRRYLAASNIATAVYYPVPIHKLGAYQSAAHHNLKETERACDQVLSLPMHTELTPAIQERISVSIHEFMAHHD